MSGDFSSISRPPTQKDVARKAGVSQAAVSAVLTGNTSKIGVSEPVRQRILQAASALQYRPNGSARSMRSRRFFNLGYCLPSYRLELGRVDFSGGVHDAARDRRHQITWIRLPTDEAESETELPDIFAEARLDALIIQFLFPLPSAVEAMLQKAQLPIIWINRELEHNAVYPNDESGGLIATRHLIQRGYRHIDFFSTRCLPLHYSNAARQRGYDNAMREAGLNPHVVEIRHEGAADLREPMREWLSTPNRPEAVFCYSDQEAVFVQMVAMELGIRIPEDIAVVGYNDDSHCGLFWTPLTTMRLPNVEIGQAAVEMALTLVDSKPGELLPARAIRPELIVRSSTPARVYTPTK